MGYLNAQQMILLICENAEGANFWRRMKGMGFKFSSPVYARSSSDIYSDVEQVQYLQHALNTCFESQNVLTQLNPK